MENTACKITNCDQPQRTRGMCHKHYRADLRKDFPPCTVDKCETKSQISGLCLKHYHRKRRHGTTDDPAPAAPLGPCSIEDCDATVKARDLCGKHLRRWYKWGTTDLPSRIVKKTKSCTRCGEIFLKEESTTTARLCPPCHRDYKQELVAKRLRRTSGVFQSIVDLRKSQGDACAICGTSEANAPRGRFHVDHDHITGIIRGLLCGNCNLGLGHFKDNPELFQAAINYLARQAKDQ